MTGESKDFVLENRFAAEQYERYNPLAAELVASKVDVPVAVTSLAARAAQQATTTIPVVFLLVGDPVGQKFANSLARPGGNMTGFATLQLDMSGKRLALFKEAVPRLFQVTLLANPTSVFTRRFVEEYRAAASSLGGLRLHEAQASKPDDLSAAIAAVTEGGLVIVNDSMLFNERKRIAELALSRSLPSMGSSSDMTDAGLLLSYGEDFTVQFHGIAVYVDKILKGAKPADLPIPARYEFVINANTARKLGLTIPPSVLARTDRVIE